MKVQFSGTILRARSAALTALAIAALTAASAHATSLPIVNGGFDTTPGTESSRFGTGYTTIDGWSTTGYNFVFTPGSADTTGTTGNGGHLTLWGPHNGGSADNHMPATSPLGGNFIAADGAYQTAAITQNITGLTPGQQYTLGFYYAGAQQSGYTGDTTELWQVSLGDEKYSTPIINNPDHDFTGWYYDTMTFTATSTEETLSFLAVGTPEGKPPFSLLDGVGFVPAPAVPEPTSFALLFTGIAGVGGMVRNRFKK